MTAEVEQEQAISEPRRGHLALLLGSVIVTALLFTALCAPLLAPVDPARVDPTVRNLAPGAMVVQTLSNGTSIEHVALMGTDALGRDLFSRVIYGSRISLLIGFTVAAASSLLGLAIGLLCGYVRWIDAVVMRVMDGIMAIPGILLAIALVAVWRPGIGTVIVAILVPEVPRIARLVRAIVARVATEPYVEAAIASGTGTLTILVRHVMPSTWGPLLVQATFVCVSAILLEAALSFLGIGVPSDIPSWGNIIADGRQWFRLTPHVILFPAAFIVLTVLGVNLLGSGLRGRAAGPEAGAIR